MEAAPDGVRQARVEHRLSGLESFRVRYLAVPTRAARCADIGFLRRRPAAHRIEIVRVGWNVPARWEGSLGIRLPDFLSDQPLQLRVPALTRVLPHDDPLGIDEKLVRPGVVVVRVPDGEIAVHDDGPRNALPLRPQGDVLGLVSEIEFRRVNAYDLES